MAKLKMLAIDLGASSGRGIVGSFDGKKLEIVENHRFPNEPVMTNGNFSWDILRIFHEIKASISKCALSEDKDIKSIGIDTWGVDYGFIDKKGALMANPYHYRDLRTDNIQPYAFKTMPFEKLYGITGIQTINFNTIYQLMALKVKKPEQPKPAKAAKPVKVSDMQRPKLGSFLELLNPQRFDFTMFLIVVILLAFGLVMLFSASYAYSYTYFGNSYRFILRQAIFAVIGVGAMLLVSRINYHILQYISVRKIRIIKHRRAQQHKRHQKSHRISHIR